MKSKGVFIFIGAFCIAAAALFYTGISMEFILFLSGPALVLLGIGLLIKEMKWRGNSVSVPAKVTGYFEYINSGNPGSERRTIMYTMEAEYTTAEGKYIKAREQSGSNRKKYAAGSEIKVKYSRKDPELFIVEGDNSRIYAMIGIIAAGLAMAALFGYIIINGIIIEQ